MSVAQLSVPPRNESECDTRERETHMTSEAMTSGGRAPQAPVTECAPLGNSQLSTCDANSPTELEITLANPDLSPENKKFLGQKRFQNATKMVPSNILTTARRVIYSHNSRVTNMATGITARGIGARCTHVVPRDNSIISGPHWTRNLPRYVQFPPLCTRARAHRHINSLIRPKRRPKRRYFSEFY
jgi:hypothetical protein